MATTDFFESLESRADPAKIAGMNNSYLFDIEGEGQWLVRSRRCGHGDRGRRRRRRDDHHLEARRSTKIVAGEQNPTTAYMTGKLKIKGDMGAAMKLQKLF